MKKYMNRLLTVVGMMVLSFAFIACGKKSDSNNNPTTTTVSGYQMINGICYYNGQNTNNPALCQNQGSNGYQMINGICYLNGQNTNNPALCQNQGSNTRQCYGQFYDQYGRQGTCNGSNCAGYQLREVSTGLTVQCI